MVEKKITRKQQCENTKQLLYETAAKLIKEKGYYNTTIQEIVEATGVSVGAFYHHFASKEELILCWADDLDKKYSDYYMKIKDDPKYIEALDKIKAMIFYSLKVYSSLGREFTSVSYSYMMRDARMHIRMLDPKRSFFIIMNDLVEKAKIEGSICESVDNTQIIRDIVMVIRGAILDWCINGGNQDIEERSKTFVNSFINGINEKR